MAHLELRLSSGEDSLSVRRFAVREALSDLFEVSIWARSPNEAIDLDTIAGQPASFRIEGGVGRVARGERVWTGVVSAVEQEQAEVTGLSSYRLSIVPDLWLLTQRSNYRVFQHVSAPEIVRRVLADWRLEATWNIDPARHPKLEYRVQHDETDECFVRRILEEAGISFLFADDGGGSALVFSDAPHAASEREGGPIHYADNPNEAAGRPFVTDVRLHREVRPGRIVLADHDFRSKADYRARAEAAASGGDPRLEQYLYNPGSFLTEGHRRGDTPFADQHGVARIDERSARRQADARRGAEEAQRSRVAFRTNALDLHPGRVFCLANHPRPELGAGKRLLVTSLSIEGTHDGEWTASGSAAFAAHPYYPARVTRKPTLHSVESAIVVGPPGEEIHTDEHGRVRVQFHWDRSDLSEHSSCWIRVSQGWAGGAFGMLALPRVGQEVLVAFLGGDPDQPIVVGRVFNGSAPVPYKLPEHKTRSTWKSDSSPGSGGFNEIMFEDAKGQELVYVQAERDFERLVKRDEVVTVERNRATTIGEVDASAVGTRHTVNIKGTPTGTEIVAGRISFTTGAATITIDGPNITLDASSMVTLKAGSNVVIHADADVIVHGGAHVAVIGAANVTVGSGGSATVQAGGGDLVLQGGPMVKVNPGAGGKAGVGESAMIPGFEELPIVMPPEVDIEANIGLALENAIYDSDRPTWFWDMVKPGGEWDFTGRGMQFHAFSVYHLGLMGGVVGYPLPMLLRLCGRHRIERGDINLVEGDPGTGLWGGRHPFGTDSITCRMLQAGYESALDAREPALTGHPEEPLVARRLPDVDSWEVYEVAASEEGGAMCTVFVRSAEGLEDYEYAIWMPDGDDVAATGTVPRDPEGRTSPAVLDRVLSAATRALSEAE